MKLRLAVASDLHFEFASSVALDIKGIEDADLFFAVGDIHNGVKALPRIGIIPIPTIYVLGNHEFYGNDIEETRVAIANVALQYPSVRVLDDAVTEYTIRETRVRVIGGTLWTDYKLFGESNRIHSMTEALRSMNDHRLIRYQGHRWLPENAVEAHERTKSFIASELAKPFDGITIVATHHSPTVLAGSPKYANDRLNPAFHSDLEDLVVQADVWIFGHLHWSTDFGLGKCRVISNQRGYYGENPDFALKIFEIDISSAK